MMAVAFAAKNFTHLARKHRKGGERSTRDGKGRRGRPLHFGAAGVALASAVTVAGSRPKMPECVSAVGSVFYSSHPLRITASFVVGVCFFVSFAWDRTCKNYIVPSILVDRSLELHEAKEAKAVSARTLRFSPAVELGGCSKLPNWASMILPESLAEHTKVG